MSVPIMTALVVLAASCSNVFANQSLDDLILTVRQTDSARSQAAAGHMADAHQQGAAGFDNNGAPVSTAGRVKAASAQSGSSPFIETDQSGAGGGSDTLTPAPIGSGADAKDNRSGILMGAWNGILLGAAMGAGLVLTPAKWAKDAGWDNVASAVAALLIVPAISVAITGAVLGLFYGAWQGAKS